MKKAKPSRRQPSSTGRKLPASSTSDILAGGFAAPKKRRKERVAPKWAKHHEKLMQLREYLMNQREQLAKEANEESPRFSMHMADSGTDSFDRDFALSLLSSEQNALYEIDEALNRIKNGTYGICELTGKPIPRARLEAIPWTRFTVDAQRRLEREGTIAKARLGDLGSLQETAVTEAEENDTEEKPADNAPESSA